MNRIYACIGFALGTLATFLGLAYWMASPLGMPIVGSEINLAMLVWAIWIGGCIYLFDRSTPWEVLPPRWTDYPQLLRAGNLSIDGLGSVVYRWYHFIPNNRSLAAGQLVVGLNCELPGSFSISPENAFDTSCLNWGLATEYQTGDEDFDRYVYIRSDDESLVRMLFQDERRRNAVIALLLAGFTEVGLGAGLLYARRSGFSGSADEAERETERAAVALGRLLEGVRLPIPSPPHESEPRNTRTFLPLLVGLAAIPLLGLVLQFATPIADVMRLLLYTGLLSVSLLILFGIMSARLLRGSPLSHYRWLKVMLVALVSFPVGVWGSLVYINGAFDESNPIVRECIVTDKFTTQFKRTTYYYVKYQPWFAPLAWKIETRPDNYEKIVPGKSKLVAVCQAGFLGMEWVKSVELR